MVSGPRKRKNHFKYSNSPLDPLDKLDHLVHHRGDGLLGGLVLVHLDHGGRGKLLVMVGDFLRLEVVEGQEVLVARLPRLVAPVAHVAVAVVGLHRCVEGRGVGENLAEEVSTVWVGLLQGSLAEGLGCW